MRRHIYRYATLLLVIALIASCSGGESPGTQTPGAAVATVTVSPAAGTVLVSQTTQLVATVLDASGNTLSGHVIAWSTSPAGVATVSSSGFVTGIAAGTVTVTATADGKSGSATIAVGETSNVGAAGGTFQTSNGAVRVDIPAGALTGTAAISAVPLINPPGASLLAPGTTFQLGPEGTQFAKPVTLSLKYDPSKLPAGTDQSQLLLYTLNGTTWTLADSSSVNVATQTVTGAASHFSGWTVCKFPCGPDLPALYFGLDNANFTQRQGSAVQFHGSTEINNYGGAIAYTPGVLPAGITLTATGASRSNGYEQVTFTYNIAGTTIPGVYHTRIFATGGALSDWRPVDITVTPTSFTVTPAPAALTVVQGGVAASNLTIGRVGVIGSITLSAPSLPTGVTASFSPASGTDPASILTISASLTAPAGNFTATLRGSNALTGDVDFSLPITVVASSGFSLAGTPPFASMTSNGTGVTGVQATRAAGFTGTITYAATGMPAGMQATFAATSVADSTRVTLTGSGVALGTYNVTVTGSSGTKSSSTTIVVTVAAGNVATVQLDLSSCIAAGRTLWLAYQDGNSAFTRVTGTGGVYSFPIATGKGAVAVVVQNGNSNTTYVNYGVPSELPLSNLCFPDGNKNATFSVTGLAAADYADITMGSYTVVLSQSTPSYQMTGIIDGVLDIVGWRYDRNTPGVNVRGVVRRDQTIPSGATVPVLDFNGAESFAPVSAPMSISGVGGETSITLKGYRTGGSCSTLAFLGSNAPASNMFYGFPSSVQRAGDLHELQVQTPTRIGIKRFHTMASQSITLGSMLTSPQVTSLGGSYRRLQVALTLPSDYSVAQYSYSDANNTMLLSGNTGYFGGGAMTLSAPDLSGVSGFNNAWEPAAGSTGHFAFTGQTAQSAACSDGATFLQAGLTGTN